MKLNIEVDLSEYYAEDFESDPDFGAAPTSSLSAEIKNVISYEVRSAISAQIRDDVRKLTQEAYTDFGEEKIKTMVDFKMEEFLASGKVAKTSCSNELVPITEKLRSIFDNSNRWSSPYEAMEKIGEKFSSECKKRYDMAFASSIVTGLEKQGLLKPGVFEVLTSDSET